MDAAWESLGAQASCLLALRLPRTPDAGKMPALPGQSHSIANGNNIYQAALGATYIMSPLTRLQLIILSYWLRLPVRNFNSHADALQMIALRIVVAVEVYRVDPAKYG
jgi:hypothetical protein